MWPDISPDSGAATSAILALIREWPVFHISGLPPSRAISSKKVWLVLTSAMIVAPGWRASTSAARICRIWSPNTIRPLPSTTPIRSPSPSKPMPSS